MPINYTEQQLNDWVNEAEAGYDIDNLRACGEKTSHAVTVFLNQSEIDALDKLAAEKNVSRDELVRQAIALITAA